MLAHGPPLASVLLKQLQGVSLFLARNSGLICASWDSCPEKRSHELPCRYAITGRGKEEAVRVLTASPESNCNFLGIESFLGDLGMQEAVGNGCVTVVSAHLARHAEHAAQASALAGMGSGSYSL